MRLTREQIIAADKLRSARPPVIEGTCVVMDDKMRSAWYAEVLSEMDRTGVVVGQTREFCDRAGVPD